MPEPPVPKERVILALKFAIERSIADLSKPFANEFTRYVAQSEPQIKNSRVIEDFDLACLYNFASVLFLLRLTRGPYCRLAYRVRRPVRSFARHFQS